MADPDSALAVLEARAQLDAARLQLAQAQRGSLPSLSLTLAYSKGSGPPGLGGLSVSVTGSYTLYDGGKQDIAVQQAEARVDSAQRALVTAQNAAESGLQRSAALRLERATLQADQAARRHAAGALSDIGLADAALPLQEAEDAALAAVHALGGAFLALAIDLSVDLQDALAAIAG